MCSHILKSALTRGCGSKKKKRRSQLVEQETDPIRPPPRYLCVQPLQAVLYRPLSAALMKRVAVTYTRKLLAGHLAMQALLRLC
jgi:hypothetical protein